MTSTAHGNCPATHGWVEVKKALPSGSDNYATTYYQPVTGETYVIDMNTPRWDFYKGAAFPGECSATKADFWGVLAQEVGHAYGLWHFDTSQEGSLPTMNSGAKPCDTMQQRNLTSDDEAGIHAVDTGNYIPNLGFERVSDTIANISINAFYWNEVGANTARACDSNAYSGSCYEKVPDGGKISQSVAFLPQYPTLHYFSIRVNNRGSTDAIRLKVIDTSTVPDREELNDNCSIPGDGTWRICSFPWTTPQVSASHRFLFEISRLDNNHGMMWVDLVQGTGPIFK